MSESNRLADHTLLIANLDSLFAPYHLNVPIAAAATLTRSRLVILLISPLFDPSSSNGKRTNATHWDALQRLLTYVYVQATKVAQEADRILMDVDVFLRGSNEVIEEQLVKGVERVFTIAGETPFADLPSTLSGLPWTWLAPGGTLYLAHGEPGGSVPSQPSSTQDGTKTFPVVALGGTFDHLHAGHKILLSMAAWIASEKLIVGVTDDALLKSKSNKHLLEPLSTRISRVRGFLTLFKPSLTYDVVPLSDVYGPTAWDPNVQALVVSKETLPGASSIHKLRAQKSLPPLQTFVIDVISSTNASLDAQDAEKLKQAKMSSTFIREWIRAKQEGL